MDHVALIATTVDTSLPESSMDSQNVQHPTIRIHSFSTSASPTECSPPSNQRSFHSQQPLQDGATLSKDVIVGSLCDRRRKTVHNGVPNKGSTMPQLLSVQGLFPCAPVAGCNLGGPGTLGVVPLLTPPEEAQDFDWTRSTLPEETQDCERNPGQAPIQSERHNSLSTPQDTPNLNAGNEPTSSTRTATTRPTAISLPDAGNMSQQIDAPSSVLDRAINALIMCQPYVSTNPSIQMVVQALPSQIKNSTAKPTFQRAAEKLQQRGQFVPYLTINHALSQLIGMDQLPVSPPATPNMMSSSDDYFQRQTIFTHGAAVRTYHGPGNAATASLMSSIAPPQTVNLAVLERYIPPTSAEEVEDFFRNSHRSYLVDRLTELSTDNGALLVTYPTKKGATTFAKDYVGVVLEPFIRQFVILNNLTTDAAVALGKTGAVDSIMEFEEMRKKLSELCESFAPIAPTPDGQRSTFQIVHSEKVEVVLDRQTWMEWFVEQEAPRMRQDLIDYQKAGGRMPAREFAASPAALVREVEEGLKSSRRTAGGTGIEIGVFVIRRSPA